MELKPCPFCGATEPTVHLLDAPESAVVCDYKMGGCGADAGLFNTNGRAIEAWNTRAERTCELSRGTRGLVHVGTGHCSECGAETVKDIDGSRARYCLFCGARVVRQ